MEVRINKFLAEAGVASRRQADKLVESGQVTINGIKAKNADKVKDGDKVIFSTECVAVTGSYDGDDKVTDALKEQLIENNQKEENSKLTELQSLLLAKMGQ